MNEHEGYRFDAHAGFIAHLGKGDVIVLGLALYFANILALKLFSHPMLKGLLIVGALAATYLLGQVLKRVLAPYPKLTRHFFDWYLGGVDAVVPGPDTSPVPLWGTKTPVNELMQPPTPLQPRVHARL